jgi:hypothetical protein
LKSSQTNSLYEQYLIFAPILKKKKKLKAFALKKIFFFEGWEQIWRTSGNPTAKNT